MNVDELAKAMIEWGDMKRQLDALGAGIEAAVLELGKTQTVGSVRASYSAGRKKYDYGLAYDDAYDDSDDEKYKELIAIAQAHTKAVTDYRAACKEAAITDIPFTQGEPSVSLKLTE